MKIMLVGAKRVLACALARHSGIRVLNVCTESPALERQPDGPREVRYAGGAKLDPRAVWQMRQLMRHERPDVVHAFFGRPLAHVALASNSLLHRPRIVSLRGIVDKLTWHDPGDWVTYWHPLVDAHACESEAVRTALIQSRIPAERCSVVFNCIDDEKLTQPGRAGLRQFDVPQNAFVISTMATMRPVKGIDLLLKAAIACADLADMYLVLFGRVQDPRINALAADPRIRDRVRLVGHRADARNLVSGADLLIMPSRAEGVAHALLEGMHQGVCPVVSDAGAMKEVVRHGQDGLVAPRENVAELADVIRRLHGDRRLVAQYAASARQRVREHFTADKMAERMISIYHDLTGQRKLEDSAPYRRLEVGSTVEPQLTRRAG